MVYLRLEGLDSGLLSSPLALANGRRPCLWLRALSVWSIPALCNRHRAALPQLRLAVKLNPSPSMPTGAPSQRHGRGIMMTNADAFNLKNHYDKRGSACPTLYCDFGLWISDCGFWNLVFKHYFLVGQLVGPTVSVDITTFLYTRC